MKKKNQKWIISVLTFVLFFLMSIGLSAEVAPPYSASLLANPPFDNLGNNSTATLVQALLGQFQLRLTVTDSAGNSDSTTYTLRGRLPPPDWIEIPPFSAGKDDAHLIKTDSNETRDEEGLTATASKDFTIRQGTEIEADFMCSLDKQTWRSCDDLYLLFRKQWIYLKDDEGLAKHSIPYEDINRRTW